MEFRFSSLQLKLKVRMLRFAFSLLFKSRSHEKSPTCRIRTSPIQRMALLEGLTTIRCTNLITNRQMQSVLACKRSHHTYFNRNSQSILKRWSSKMHWTMHWMNLRRCRTVIVGIKAISRHRYQVLRPSSTRLRYSCKVAGPARVLVLPRLSIIWATQIRRCQ